MRLLPPFQAINMLNGSSLASLTGLLCDDTTALIDSLWPTFSTPSPAPTGGSPSHHYAETLPCDPNGTEYVSSPSVCLSAVSAHAYALRATVAGVHSHDDMGAATLDAPLTVSPAMMHSPSTAKCADQHHTDNVTAHSLSHGALGSASITPPASGTVHTNSIAFPALLVGASIHSPLLGLVATGTAYGANRSEEGRENGAGSVDSMVTDRVNFAHYHHHQQVGQSTPTPTPTPTPTRLVTPMAMGVDCWAVQAHPTKVLGPRRFICSPPPTQTSPGSPTKKRIGVPQTWPPRIPSPLKRMF
jgi:hypothetical protein